MASPYSSNYWLLQTRPNPQVTYIYCLKLPGFQCQIEANPVPHPDLYPPSIGVPKPPHYTMVKVGISTEPATRLYNIMRGFEGFGASHKGTQFQHIQEGDSPDDTLEKGKFEENIVFIKKCTQLGDAERNIRKLIGHPEFNNEAFQEKFKKSLSGDRQGYIDQVGMTEWVLVPTELTNLIQGDYRRNWCGRIPKPNDLRMAALLENCTAQRFYGRLFQRVSAYHNPPFTRKSLVPFNVSITFTTGFRFPITIRPKFNFFD